MAKKVTTRPGEIQPGWTKHICDDCKHRNWIETQSNKDWEGKFLCLACPFEDFHILRGRRACDKWQPITKEAKR